MKLTKPKEKKELSLTLKQRLWIKEYISTGNATEAAMRVYKVKDRESAGTIGSEIILEQNKGQPCLISCLN